MLFKNFIRIHIRVRHPRAALPVNPVFQVVLRKQETTLESQPANFMTLLYSGYYPYLLVNIGTFRCWWQLLCLTKMFSIFEARIIVLIFYFIITKSVMLNCNHRITNNKHSFIRQ